VRARALPVAALEAVFEAVFEAALAAGFEAGLETALGSLFAAGCGRAAAIGRTFTGASTLCCTSNSLALNGPALGAVAPEPALRETVLSGGFKDFRRVNETPFNRIFEARN